MNIQRSARLAAKLAQRHGGAATGAHSVASRLIAGIAVPHSDPDVARAVEELAAQKSRRRNRIDVKELAELTAWLTGPVDTCRHFVSGAVHVYLDVVDAGSPRATSAGRIVVRDRQDKLRVWPFEDLQVPWLAGATAKEHLARAAAEAVDAFGFDCSANRFNAVPSWVAPVEIADAIHDGADHDASGQVVARAAKKGEEP